MTVVAVAVAGAAGALARYALSGWVSDRASGAFPWGTFVVNATGSFLLGVVFALLTERFLPHPTLRTAVTIGFLGAYTTFSTYSFETVRLIEDGAIRLAVANALGSVAVGIGAVWIGLIVGRTV